MVTLQVVPSFGFSSATRLLAALLCFAVISAHATSAPSTLLDQAVPTGGLHVTVTHPNGVSLGAAFVLVEQNDRRVAQGRTTPSGSAFLQRLAPGNYKILIEKQGYYSVSVEKVEI